ncbi:hypothetical protein Vadar_034273 [Vaccinium darrowii]|uniref:Uncharacterized protein n=1 Tax=Vaccinium darrowii TaxID=229202 RepID=A0ACB7Y593_9ERIC|nr:hypothetical protein Vadar_034273 [Vaccinium darrowii]
MDINWSDTSVSAWHSSQAVSAEAPRVGKIIPWSSGKASRLVAYQLEEHLQSIINYKSSILVYLCNCLPSKHYLGTNYEDWKESLAVNLAIMNLDLAIREEAPPKSTAESSAEEKAYYESSLEFDGIKSANNSQKEEWTLSDMITIVTQKEAGAKMGKLENARIVINDGGSHKTKNFKPGNNSKPNSKKKPKKPIKQAGSTCQAGPKVEVFKGKCNFCHVYSATGGWSVRSSKLG